jgi:hypothetical protein
VVAGISIRRLFVPSIAVFASRLQLPFALFLQVQPEVPGSKDGLIPTPIGELTSRQKNPDGSDLASSLSAIFSEVIAPVLENVSSSRPEGDEEAAGFVIKRIPDAPNAAMPRPTLVFVGT